MSLAGRWFAALVLCAAAILHVCGPAAAALRLCNQTSYVLTTAVGMQKSTMIVTRGWTRIFPGDCATTNPEPLDAATYFLYARTSHAHAGPTRAWGGAFRFCVKDKDFSLQTPVGEATCPAEDEFLAPFAVVEKGNAKNWTTTFTESPRIASLDAARTAGVDRLLGDVGIAPGKDGKRRDKALAQFRSRAKLPDAVDADALFTALETEAAKVSSPTGYSICNDGNSEVWAAIGFNTGHDYMSRGWWRIAKGSCAKALSDPLGPGIIYLYAAKHGDNRLVSGATMLCTRSAAFDVLGNADCAARGYKSTGFAPTNLQGLPGFSAHIGNQGLLNAPQAVTPK